MHLPDNSSRIREWRDTPQKQLRGRSNVEEIPGVFDGTEGSEAN
jgi:hypothetical protein